MTLSFRFGTVGSPNGTPKKPGGSVGAIQFSNHRLSVLVGAHALNSSLANPGIATERGDARHRGRRISLNRRSQRLWQIDPARHHRGSGRTGWGPRPGR